MGTLQVERPHNQKKYALSDTCVKLKTTTTMHPLIGLESSCAFIKPDQPDPWINDLIQITLLSTVSHLQLPNFV